jgi:hypothetical protein
MRYSPLGGPRSGRVDQLRGPRLPPGWDRARSDLRQPGGSASDGPENAVMACAWEKMR